MPISDIITPTTIPPATDSNSGLMSAEDKNKLDGIGTATEQKEGLVKPDGTTITIDNGVLTSHGGEGSAPIWREATI